jgi:4-nitrophenyl phosphatase
MGDWRQAAGLLIDLDGTLFRGEEIIPGAHDFMAEVERLGIPYLFWTNNSTRTREVLAGHLNKLGFRAVPERIYTSANALADTVRVEMAGAEMSAFVIGEKGLREAVGSVATIREEGPADLVAVGLDRGLTYGSLARATRLLIGGALFLATNADRILPVEDGVAPGAGAILALLETASGHPARVLGKPQPQFVAAACATLGIRPQDAWVIGDNPETDIAAGLSAGATTILVETGVGTVRRDGPRAHFSVPSVASLLSG